MQLEELGKQVIRDEQPAGSEVRFDEDFEALAAEIERLSTPSADGRRTDWKRVVELGAKILAKKSKHLLVACYLAAGLVETRGVEGLALGATVLADLVTVFWDTLYPAKKRMRGRLNAVEWWLDRTETHFAANVPTPLPAELKSRVLSQLNALDQALAQRSEAAPPLARLIELVERWPEKREPPPPVAPSDEPAATPRASPHTVASAAEPPEDPEQLVAFGLKQLVAAADTLMQQDLANPLIYHLVRIGAWLGVDRLPLAEGGQTPIPPPEANVRQAIEHLLAAGDHPGVIREAESQLRGHLFWLDLSRFSARAIEALGPTYRPAHEAVCSQTAAFVRRLEGVEALAFSDGTPFADPDTRAWLQTLGTQPQAEGMGLVGHGAEGDQAEWDETIERARSLIRDKRLVEGVSLVQRQLTQARSGAHRLRWGIALAQLLTGAGLAQVARPVSKELLEQVDRHALEDWDPQLALQALTVAHRAWSDGGQPTEVRPEDLLDRIARLSPAAAIGLMSR